MQGFGDMGVHLVRIKDVWDRTETLNLFFKLIKIVLLEMEILLLKKKIFVKTIED